MLEINKRSIICIPIESIRRELDTKINLSMEIANAGFTCLIGKKNALKFIIKNNPQEKFIYFEKGVDPSQKEFYKKFSSKNKLFDIQEEGNIVEDLNLIFRAYKKEILPFINKIFVWGRNQEQLLKRKFKNYNKKFVLSGSPNFDLCNKNKLEYYVKLSKLRSAIPKERFILINTNFGVKNRTISNIELNQTYKTKNKDLKYIDELYESELYRERNLYEYQSKIFDEFLNITKELKKIDNKIKIVLRPHPAENENFYKNYFKDDDIIVENTGNVKEWISSAFLVITHDCTTGIEAFLMNKLVINFNPIKDRENIVSKMANEVGVNCENNEDLKKYVTKLLNDHEYFESEKKNNYLKKINNIGMYIENIEKLSSDIIIEQLQDELIKENNHKLNKLTYLKLSFNFLTWISLILKKISIVLGFQTKKHKYFLKKFDKLKRHDIEIRYKVLCEMNVEFKKIRFSKIISNLYIFTK